MFEVADRKASIRAAVLRDRRKRGEGGELAGLYRGKRVFRLAWEPAAQGYRRTFPPGRWTWDDGRVWTGGEVRVMVKRGAWRRVLT